MAVTNVAFAANQSDRTIPVRKITAEDLNFALREGWNDFLEKRGDLIVAGLIYPLIGLITAAVTLGSRFLPLFYPVAAGISLLGPIVAVGFYELARRREAGLESNWTHFFDVRKRPSAPGIVAVAGLLIAIFVGWIFAASLLFVTLWGGYVPTSIGDFATRLFTTGEGWALIIVGNAVGALFAALVLAVSLVSLPMLVDCTISGHEAVSTSVRASLANAGLMVRWGLTIAVLLLLGSIPLFIGLAVVLPVLGYATWHLYTRLIDRSALEICKD